LSCDRMQNLNVPLQLQHVFSTGNRLARTATQLKLCKQDGLKKNMHWSIR